MLQLASIGPCNLISGIAMTFRSWRDAVKFLTVAMQPITDVQQALAKHAGIRISRETPSIVASALLKVALATELHLTIESEIHEYLAQRIVELQEFGPGVIKPKTFEEAAAWVDYLQLALRRTHLERLKIVEGDVVSLEDDSTAIISSIGEDGRVYFQGGKGYRRWPDLIRTVVARRNANSEDAKKIRRDAENAAALRRTSAAWSSVRSDDLADFAVSLRATHERIDRLENIIAQARDERPIQQFLQQHGELLTALLGGRERFCIPQQRLGAAFIPDFIVGDTDSLGIRWVLIELETPRSGIYQQDGVTLDRFARKGVQQIIQWRQWLSLHVAHAHEPRRNKGLGLYDISAQSEGIVLVGRREMLPPKASESNRLELRDANRIRVHTYDWLLDMVRGAISHAGGPINNPYILHKDNG
jgi:hypothetical protein